MSSWPGVFQFGTFLSLTNPNPAENGDDEWE